MNKESHRVGLDADRLTDRLRQLAAAGAVAGGRIVGGGAVGGGRSDGPAVE